MPAPEQNTPDSAPPVYQIRVEGILREDWSDWLNGMQIAVEQEDRQPPTTTLTGTVIDQAVLRGLLCRLWDLNLGLISVQRMEQDAQTKAGKK